jgi:hypothetical protein
MKACSKNGKPGFKWGDNGFCYTYTPGNKESLVSAKAKCMQQAKAIEANKHGQSNT